MRLIAEKNPVLWKSIRVYQSQRAQHGLEEVSNLTRYNTLKQELREQMVVNAGVMIRKNFEKRLRLYVLIKKEKKEKRKLVNAIMRACKSANETDVAEALQIRDVVAPDGTDWSARWILMPHCIQENGLAFYIRLLWKLSERGREEDSGGA